MSASASAVRVTLIGRQGCHLCVPAAETVRAVTDRLGVPWEQVSLDDRPDLEGDYGELIPVVLIDGQLHQHWRINADRLTAALGSR
jgi:hypothetical protein